MDGVILTTLRPADMSKAIRFAIDGMHFDMYLEGKLLLQLYGRYFLCDEMNKATQVIAAYRGGELVGLLLAQMTGEKPCCHSFLRGLYVRLADFVQKLFFRESVGVYDQVNREMFAEYSRTHQPDGQIVFLAAAPGTKGVGTLLLQELERREPGKTVYLYTDDNCTWQFYERRGFDRVGERDITMELKGQQVPLKCLLYSKKIQ